MQAYYGGLTQMTAPQEMGLREHVCSFRFSLSLFKGESEVSEVLTWGLDAAAVQGRWLSCVLS